MIRVRLETLVMGNMPGTSIMVLRPVPQEGECDQILPIYIGPVEAAFIAKALSDEPSSRPMTHSLLCTVMGTLGGKLRRVVISKVKGTVFYATLHIEQAGDITKVDARPSDAIALAVRLHVPMYVTEKVLAQAGFPAWVNMRSACNQAVMREFHEFVENLSPEDFK